MTEQTIATVLASENPAKIKFDVLVIESEKSLFPFQFNNTRTVYPEGKFGFNKYLNIGLKSTNNKFVCLCNNDLIFYQNWASEILAAMEGDNTILSATPYCRNYHQSIGYTAYTTPAEGYFGVFTGWCFFVKRTIFDTIGKLDEKLLFWYCDNDYLQLLLQYKIKNVLVPTSFIRHLGSESLKGADQKLYDKLTLLPQLYYNYKWHHRSILRYKAEKLIFTLKQAFQ
ncbi:glycosyltransferase family 2 protein [Mucilaginibacter arboris]|uniref:Glycosyltransferase n=1 Tax=Mucilaginibacter arboris TaxID=2682090 RepID=A0A7K1STN5_9SPHI|nr:glycosyltransferase [Mucilaginibacter arboris]MVN20627.1 glycosyltransferase [Mucilaginibacter arboris]